YTDRQLRRSGPRRGNGRSKQPAINRQIARTPTVAVWDGKDARSPERASRAFKGKVFRVTLSGRRIAEERMSGHLHYSCEARKLVQPLLRLWEIFHADELAPSW